MLRNYPLPAVFFYRREENGQIFYDVIDGKQRVESILMFIGQMRGRYEVKCKSRPGSDEAEWLLKLEEPMQAEASASDYRLSHSGHRGGRRVRRYHRGLR